MRSIVSVVRLVFALALVSGLAVGIVSGQQPPCSANCDVEVGKAFTVLFDAPSAGPVTGYRVYLDGVKLGADIASTGGTTSLPGVSVSTTGPHKLEVSAFNSIGEGPKAVLGLNGLTVPGAPANLRIQVVFTVAQDGSISVRVVGIEQGPR